jgi:hypothetical protein
MDHWYGDRRWYIYQERNLLWMVVVVAIVFAATVGEMANAGADKKWQSGKVAEWQSGEEKGQCGEKKWQSGKVAKWCGVLSGALVLALPLSGTIGMMTVTREEWTVYKPNPDWRGAAGLIVADGGEDARVLEEETFQLDPLWYYLGGLRREGVPRGADLGAELLKRVGGGVVYVVSQQHRWPYRVERLERPGLQVKEIGRVSGVVVYRVGRQEPHGK